MRLWPSWRLWIFLVLLFCIALPPGLPAQLTWEFALPPLDSCELVLAEPGTFPLNFSSNINPRPERPELVLVLSGGGARGFAHIGVLKALEENHLKPDLIIGTSIGAVIGGLYAAGYRPEEILQFAQELDWNSLITNAAHREEQVVSQKSIPRRHIFQIRLKGISPYIPPSLSYGQQILFLLYSRLLEANLQAGGDFDRLPIPFRAVTTDLVSGKRVVLDHGDLAEAISASMAFPLLFAPFPVNGMLLVDGGITDNLPVDVAQNMGARCIVAVDVTAPMRPPDQMRAPWEIADQVTTIMMQKRLEESRAQADVLIRPNISAFQAVAFQMIDSLYLRGYQETLRHIAEIKTCLQEQKESEQAPGNGLLSYEEENVYLGRVARVSFWEYPGNQADSLPEAFRTSPGSHLYLGDLRWDLRTLGRRLGPDRPLFCCLKGDSARRDVRFIALEPIRVEKLVFQPQVDLPSGLAEELLDKAHASPFQPGKLLALLDSLQKKLRQTGNPLRRIERVTYLPVQHQLVLRWNPGRVDEIRLEGNHFTRPFVILREFPLRVGDAFHTALALQGLQNIYSSGLFYRVLLRIQSREGRNTLIIKVQERSYTVLQMGAHVSTERKSEGFLELMHENLFGTSTRLSLFGSVGERIRRLNISVFTFRLFKTFLTYRLDAFYLQRWDNYYRDFSFLTDYQIVRRGLHLSVGQQIARLGLISGELRLERVKVFSDHVGFPHSEFFRIRSLRIRSVVDKRDRLPFPRKGIFNRWFWETGSQRFLGSSQSYVRVFLGLEGYYSPNSRITLRPFAQLGTGDLTVPFSEWFFLGGQHDFPGLHERELFGRQFIKVGLDVRYRLLWQLPVETYFTAHLGTLGVWRRSDDRITGRDLKHGLGLSVAFNTFLGPLELTFARLFPIERNILYLSAGFSF